MSLRHHLSLSGYTTKPTIITLTADNEYRFVELMIRFIHDLDTDIKLKRCNARTGICEYIGKNASTIIGGRKDKVEEELNKLVNMLDFSAQSEQISLYNWILERNFSNRILNVHNKIFAKLRTLDSDLMLSKHRSLQKSTNIFKDVVDLVGKFLNKKAVEIFVEKIELAEGHKRGGFRDRKVSAVLTLKAAIQAYYEVDSSGEGGGQMDGAERGRSRDSKRSVDTSGTKTVSVNQMDPKSASAKKHQLEHFETERRYTLHRKQEEEEEEEQVQESFDIDDIREVSKGRKGGDDGGAKDRDTTKSKDGKTTRKVAHRYFFGDTKDLDEAKHEAKRLVKASPADQLADLDNRHEEAIAKNMELEEIYQIVLRRFNDAKKNYTSLGKETMHCQQLASFLKTEFPQDRETVKTCREVETADMPDTKKVKLTIGKILEKASSEILFEQDRIFKFALDKDDYDNQPFSNQHDVAYDLVEKEPTDTTRGVKNARNELRENKDIRATSPLAGKHSGFDEEGEDDEDMALIKRSIYYDPRQVAKREKNRGVDAYEKEIGGFKIDERVLQGMGSVILQKFLAECISPRSKRRRGEDGEMYDDDSLAAYSGSNNLSVDEILKKTVAMNKKFDLNDFESGLGPNYIEFDSRDNDNEDHINGEKALFDRDRSKRREQEFNSSAKKHLKPSLASKSRIGRTYRDNSREKSREHEPWSKASKSPEKSGSKSKRRSPVSAKMGSNNKYILYEDDDPNFGIYTNVKLDKHQAPARRVGKFKA